MLSAFSTTRPEIRAERCTICLANGIYIACDICDRISQGKIVTFQDFYLMNGNRTGGHGHPDSCGKDGHKAFETIFLQKRRTQY